MLDVNEMLVELEEETMNVVNEVHEYGITEYDEDMHNESKINFDKECILVE